MGPEEPQRKPQRWAELSQKHKAGIILVCIGYLAFAGFLIYLDATHSPAFKFFDALLKTLCVGLLLISWRQRKGEFTSTRVWRITFFLGIAWIVAMVVSMMIYAVNIMSMDEDSHPEFLMDRVNDWLLPLVMMSSLPLFLHFHKGGLKRNWRYLAVYALCIVWVVAEVASWILFGVDKNKSVKAVSLWAGIATTALGTPLLVSSGFWCSSSLKRYDASMEVTSSSEGHARDDDRPSQRPNDEGENEVRAPLLLQGTPGAHVEEP